MMQRSNFSLAHYPSGFAQEEPIQFMEREVEQQVDTKLSLHYFSQFEKTKNPLYSQLQEMTDTAREDILRLWVRGNMSQELRYLQKNTMCDDLRSYLDVITGLPTLTYE